MQSRIRRATAVMTSALLVAAAAGAAPVSAAVPPEVEQNADHWPLPNQDYQNTRSAADPGIDSSNVDDLGIAWSMPIPGQGPFGAAAGGIVIAGGIVHFQDLGANVFAVDLESGDVHWEHMRDTSLVGPTGPAIGDGGVFVSLDDQTFGALDIETGEELWSVRPPLGYLGAIQGTVYDGTVYYATQAGKSGDEGYAAGQSGVIHAADTATGEDRWTFQVVEEGFWGDPDINAGGGVWYPGAVDTESGRTFWGTGNPAPFPGTEEYPNGTSRPGPNLYTSSLIVLDHDSGDLEWYYQAVPHDLFDHDFQVSPILATTEIDGDERDVVIGAGKVGDVVAIDRETQEELWRTEVGRHENDDLEELPLGEEVTVYPGILGGVETPMAYADGMVYVPVVNIPTTHTATGWGATDGTEALNNANAETPVSEGTGALVALDASSGDIAWQHDFDSPVFAGATVSGDLVFTATYVGTIHAFDRMSGELVWSYEAPGGVIAWPAMAGDTLVWPVGLGEAPQLLALRPGAEGTVATPAATAEATPAAADATTPAATAEATSSPASDDDGQAVSVELVAQDVSFDKEEITVAAGSEVSLTLTNRDQAPHDFALYRSDAAEEAIFVGEIFSGPDAERTYEFTAPEEPGEYYFRCDVHPGQMNGTFIVE